MANKNKNLYTITTFLFLLLFLLSIFLFSKRTLEPSLSFYRDFFSQAYSYINIASPLVNSSDSDSDSVPVNPPTDQPITIASPSVPVNPPIHQPISPTELSVEDKKHPVAISPTELSVEDKKHPVAKNESFGLAIEFEKVKMCDLYMGSWVKDDEYPIYRPGSCPYVDEAFDCQSNGRQDSSYLKWRWKPDGCDLPSVWFGGLESGPCQRKWTSVNLWPFLGEIQDTLRFNATDFLERLRGKRLMLVGDSMNRNQFESLLCLLREGLPDKSRMYEIHGFKITKGRGYYIFKFLDYNCTVEFVRSHFLVKEGVRLNERGNSNPTLSIDKIDKTAKRWKRADILVFNTGHWWVHGKTARGKNYFKEGDYVYPKFDAVEAYRRALKTWANWIDSNLKPSKQLVFYRGYSSAHFRGGDWDSGGSCKGETDPILSGAFLETYPLKMKIVEEVIQGMQSPVILLNVTRLTNFRKDGHPSIYGKNVSDGRKVSMRRQDCSHWCLPGTPDAWNELIYATLVFQQTIPGKN